MAFHIVVGSVSECSRKSGAAESRRYTPELYSYTPLALATASILDVSDTQ